MAGLAQRPFSNSGPRLAIASRHLALGLAPALLFCACFFYGAYLPAPSLVLFAIGALGVALATLSPVIQKDIASIRSAGPAAVLLVLTLGVAAWSLTPWVPGGPHPIWAWLPGAPADSGAGALNTSAVILEMIRLCGLGCFFVIGCLMGVSSERARAAIRLILILGTVYAAVSLLLFLTGAQMGHRTGRLLGGFYSPNTAGTLLGVLSVLAIAWLVHRWSRTTDMRQADRLGVLAPLVAICALLIACLLLTASRSAIAATGLAATGLLIMAAIASPKSRLPIAVIGTVFLVVLGVYVFSGNTLFIDRFDDLHIAADDRVVIAQAHWRAFLASPLMGYGLGSYPEVNNQIMTADTFGPLAATIVLHNSYLQWLEEAGVLGAVPMFLLIAWLVGATAWRSIGNARNGILLAGLLLSTLVVLIHAATDVSLHVPAFAAFWSLLLGLAFTLSQASSRRRRS